MCIQKKQHDHHHEKEDRFGKFCCVSTKVGMHLTGAVSIGLIVLYFTLLAEGASHDNFNWVVLVWTFVMGIPRVACYIVIWADTILRRRIYCMCLVTTTAVECLIFVVS